MTPAAGAKLPSTFFGAMANGPLDDQATLDAEAVVMRRTGLGTVRMPFNWGAMQFAGRDVPPDFTTMDGRVAAAARNGLDVLALVLNSPPWAAREQGRDLSSPRDNADYTRFLVALIGRYGPSGTFWSANPGVPKRPVRRWQIWNEPNLPIHWSARPYPRSYRALLCASYRAVHRADPGATVVMAGLANYSWRAMAALERAGVRGCFDVAAVHPFSGRPSNSLKITRLNREALDRAGDRKPIWLTELTWSSAKGRTRNTHGWETTAAGQAVRLRQAYTLYAREAKRLRLGRIYWYTWASRDGGSPNSFEWSGLRRVGPDGTVVDKPALRALRDVIRRYAG